MECDIAQLKDLIVTGAGRVIGKLYASAFAGNGEELTDLNASNISNGTLSPDRLPTVSVANGGTGATDADTARINLGAAASSHEHSASDISSGILSSDRLPPATSNMIGGIKVGDGLSIDDTGLLSAYSYTLPPATTSALGGIMVGDGLSVDNTGLLSASGGSGEWTDISSQITSKSSSTASFKVCINEQAKLVYYNAFINSAFNFTGYNNWGNPGFMCLEAPSGTFSPVWGNNRNCNLVCWSGACALMEVCLYNDLILCGGGYCISKWSAVSQYCLSGVFAIK